jgi:hypothetical protein
MFAHFSTAELVGVLELPKSVTIHIVLEQSDFISPTRSRTEFVEVPRSAIISEVKQRLDDD